MNRKLCISLAVLAAALAIGLAARVARADDITWADLRITISENVSDPGLRDHFTNLTNALELYDLGEDVPSYDGVMDVFTEDLGAFGENETLLPVAEREAVWSDLSAASAWALSVRGSGRTTTEEVSDTENEKCMDRKTADCQTHTRHCVIKRNVKNGEETKRWCETR